MRHIILILLTSFSQFAFGQSQTKLPHQGIGEPPLIIGDKAPNLIIGTYLDNPSKKIKLYDIKASLILLDFWSISCSGCIRSVPKMDTLQNNFNSRVKILTITTDKPDDVRKTLGRLNISLPKNFIQADTGFMKFFPYNSLPHHVWLDSNYKVHYITIGSNATAQNFTAFLNGIEMPFEKKYEFIKFNSNQPLWMEGNGRLQDHLQYYSYFMKYVSGYNDARMGRRYDSAKGTCGFIAYNYPLLSIIKAAWEHFPEQTFENNNRVALEVNDSSVFIQPGDPNRYKEWAVKNAYAYELNIPFAKKNELFTIMQQDILRLFDYDIKIEKRRRPCYILFLTSSEDKLKSKGISKRTPSLAKDSIIFKNMPLKIFLSGLNRESPKPFIDETNYDGNVDLLLGCSYSDIDKLKTELHKYDLDFVEEERMIEVLIITDKKR